ncbi:MAG: hypothetical protein IAE94_04540 [Chthoniobacterales bacterium]|nr:hypothetical protein [Chthoniobacterales bacterium]
MAYLEFPLFMGKRATLSHNNAQFKGKNFHPALPGASPISAKTSCPAPKAHDSIAQSEGLGY